MAIFTDTIADGGEQRIDPAEREVFIRHEAGQGAAGDEEHAFRDFRGFHDQGPESDSHSPEPLLYAMIARTALAGSTPVSL